MNKVCPVRMALDVDGARVVNCLGSSCAWWVEDSETYYEGACFVVQATSRLASLAENIQQIKYNTQFIANKKPTF